MRSRLVWDPAHIVYLENWYMKETRYPNLAQCQMYANTLSQVAHSGETTRSVDLNNYVNERIMVRSERKVAVVGLGDGAERVALVPEQAPQGHAPGDRGEAREAKPDAQAAEDGPARPHATAADAHRGRDAAQHEHATRAGPIRSRLGRRARALHRRVESQRSRDGRPDARASLTESTAAPRFPMQQMSLTDDSFNVTFQ